MLFLQILPQSNANILNRVYNEADAPEKVWKKGTCFVSSMRSDFFEFNLQ